MWFEPEDQIIGVELCYDRGTEQKALTWLKEDGVQHSRIDDGDNPGKMKASPVLEANGPFDREGIGRRFVEIRGDVPEEIADRVYDRIIHYRP